MLLLTLLYLLYLLYISSCGPEAFQPVATLQTQSSPHLGPRCNLLPAFLKPSSYSSHWFHLACVVQLEIRLHYYFLCPPVPSYFHLSACL